MKFIIATLVLTLLINFGATEKDERRCVEINTYDMKIEKNSFVEPGIRFYSDNAWYSSVNWKAVPNGPVLVTYSVRYYSGGWQNLKEQVVEIFDIDYKTAAGSIANLMRYALGIPKFSDIKLGKVSLDRNLLQPKPCMNIYTDYEWVNKRMYEINIRVKTRQKQETLLQGYMKVRT